MENLDITGEVSRLIGDFLEWLPKLIGVIVILLVGYVVSRILRSVVSSSLRRLGLDRRLHESPADNVVRRLTDSPSQTIGKFVYWLGMIVTFTIAIFALDVPAINELLTGIYAYVPNILAAIFILVLAMAGSTAVSVLIRRLMGDTATGKIIGTVVPILILSISAFAILEQLKIAPNIVSITYTALIGSVALGFAIAMGLGARDVAARLFEDAYEKGRGNVKQVRKDIEKGRARGEQEAKEAKRRMERER